MWTLAPHGNYYAFINKYSGKCLDVTGFNASAGALLQQWSCSGDWNQQFHYLQYT